MRSRTAVFAAILAMPLRAKAADLVSGGNPATTVCVGVFGSFVRYGEWSRELLHCSTPLFKAAGRRQALRGSRRKTFSRAPANPFSTACARALRRLAIRWFGAAVGPGVRSGALARRAAGERKIQDGFSEPEEMRNEFSIWKHKQ